MVANYMGWAVMERRKRKEETVDRVGYKPYLYQAPSWDPQRIHEERLKVPAQSFTRNRYCGDCGAQRVSSGHWVDRDKVKCKFVCDKCFEKREDK